MGNDNSKSEEERRRARQQGVSRDEVNRLLEIQRREYERKLQELNVRKAPTPDRPVNVAREATEANDRNIDHILAQQVKDFVHIAYNNNSPSSNSGTQRSSSEIIRPAPSNTGTQRTPSEIIRPAPSNTGTQRKHSEIIHPLPSNTGQRTHSEIIHPLSSNTDTQRSTSKIIRPAPSNTGTQRTHPEIIHPLSSNTDTQRTTSEIIHPLSSNTDTQRTTSEIIRPIPSHTGTRTPSEIVRPAPSNTGTQRTHSEIIHPLSSNTDTQRTTSEIIRPAPSNTGTNRSSIKVPSPAARVNLPGPSGEGTSNTTASLERKRNPYNFTRDDLQNRRSPVSPQTSLYPKLETNENFGNFTKNTPPQHKVFQNSSVQRDSGEFVFVNNNQNGQGTQPQPSAPPQPTTSTPSSKNVNTSKPSQYRPKPTKNEEDTLNCRTCGKKYGLNIFQCSKGHSSCRDCKLNHVPCGICRGPIGDTRNIAMETYISEVKLAACVAELERKAPCPNSDDGCSLLLKIADMEAHLKECPYRELICPLVEIFGQCEPCKWRGKLSQIVSHFDDVHPAHRQANIDTEMILINIRDNIHVIHLIDLSPYVFLVHLKVAKEESKIYMTVQHFGTQISASKWSYELHVYNKREPRRKLQYTDICHSSTVPLAEIFGESKCVAMPQSYAMNYVNEGCLNYKFYIKREYDPVPSSRGKWRGGGRGRGRGRGAQTSYYRST